MTRLTRAKYRLAALMHDIRITPTWQVVSPVGSDGVRAHVVLSSGESTWLPWRDLRRPGAPMPSDVPNVSTDDLLNPPTININ